MDKDIESFLKENCNKLTNGTCHTGRCLKRAGWSTNKPHLYDYATCPAIELHSMAKDVDRFHEVSDTGL